MIKGHHPFGITPEMIAEFDRKQDRIGVTNHPIRDVAKETFWDFMNSPECTNDEFFTREALSVLGR